MNLIKNITLILIAISCVFSFLTLIRCCGPKASTFEPAVIDLQQVIKGAIEIKDSNARKVIYTQLDSLRVLELKWNEIDAKRKAAIPYSTSAKFWADSLTRFTKQNISILSRIKTPE